MNTLKNEDLPSWNDSREQTYLNFPALIPGDDRCPSCRLGTHCSQTDLWLEVLTWWFLPPTSSESLIPLKPPALLSYVLLGKSLWLEDSIKGILYTSTISRISKSEVSFSKERICFSLLIVVDFISPSPKITVILMDEHALDLSVELEKIWVFLRKSFHLSFYFWEENIYHFCY